MKVLGDKRTSELGRFAITRDFEGLGAFKTPTLRNVAVTSPYMHDGSLKTLKDVVVHYNNGGVTKEGDPVNDFLSGGIRPLNLTEQEIDDLVSFMEALTSPEFASLPSAARTGGEAMNPSTIVPSRRDFLKGGGRRRRRRRRSHELREARLRRPRPGLHLRLHLGRPHPARLGHQVRPQLGPRPHPGGGGDEPPHPEARLRDVRGRPRPARHEGGARPRGGDALEAPRPAPLRDGGARLLPRPRGVLVEALRAPPLQLRPQGRPLRRAEQHPHLRRLDLQQVALGRGADAPDGRPRQPERLAVHGRREAAGLAQGRPRQGRRRRRRSSSSRTRRSRSSTRAGTSGPRTPRRCRRSSRRSTR